MRGPESSRYYPIDHTATPSAKRGVSSLADRKQRVNPCRAEESMVTHILTATHFTYYFKFSNDRPLRRRGFVCSLHHHVLLTMRLQESRQPGYSSAANPFAQHTYLPQLRRACNDGVAVTLNALPCSQLFKQFTEQIGNALFT